MNFKQQIIQNYLWKGLYFIVVFFVGIVINRSLEVKTTGWINFITNNFALAISFGSLSLEVAVLYFAVSKKIPLSQLATFSLLWIVLVTLVFILTSHLFVTNSTFVKSKELLNFAAICYFLGLMLVNFFSNLFISQKQFFVPYFLLIVINLLLIAIAPNVDLFHILLTKDEFIYYYFGAFLIQGLVLLVGYYNFRNQFTFTLPNQRELKLLFKYGLAAFLGNISYFFLLKIDFWLLRFYNNDLEQYGNYTTASRTIQMFLMVVMIASSSFFINTAEPNSKKRDSALLLKLIRVMLVFYFVASLIFIFFGDKIFVGMYGQSFSQMYKPFLAFMPGMFALCVIVLLGAFFGGSNKIIVNTFANIIGIIAIVVLSLIILPINNSPIVAAAISSISYLVALAYSLYNLKKITDFNYMELIQFKKDDFNWITKLIKK